MGGTPLSKVAVLRRGYSDEEGLSVRVSSMLGTRLTVDDIDSALPI